MTLQEMLLEHRPTILERWLDSIIESYPAETAKFLKRESDRFLNPVAYEFREGIRDIYDALTRGAETEKLFPLLDRVIRIRAVQDLSASHAVGFVFSLKRVLREDLAAACDRNGLAKELEEFDSRIDGLALVCFDVYTKRREKLYELKVKEMRTRLSGLLRMAGLVAETPDHEQHGRSE